MLAGDARILDGNAIARRAMTAGAGGNLLGGNAATVDFLAQVDRVLVFRGARLGQLRAQVGGDILLVGVAEHLRVRRHDGLVALRRREVDQLLVDIAFVLAGQLRIDRDGRIAGRAMAGDAGRQAARRIAIGVQGSALGSVSLDGRFRCFDRGGSCRYSQQSEQHGFEQR